jgi:hypothetical protein
VNRTVAGVLLLSAGCTGTGPSRSLASILAEQGLEDDAPVILVDIDDTIYERGHDLPMRGAADSLQELSEDHLIVYLTARPTYAKLPGLTHNRGDSREFLEEHGFPDAPLFTSSLCNLVLLGRGDGKVASLAQLREYGVETISLAVGDRPHDLRAYMENESITVERCVIILIEDADRPDRDRERLPVQILEREIPGHGPAWPRIQSAYESGALEGQGAYVVSQPPRVTQSE